MAKTFDELPKRARDAILRALKISRHEVTPARVSEISIEELGRLQNVGAGTIRTIGAWLVEHGIRPEWSDVQPREPLDEAADALRIAAKRVSAAGLVDRADEILAIASSIITPAERARARQNLETARLEALASREALAAARQAAEAEERRRIETIVRMKDEAGMTFRAIARELDLPATTVRELYHKAARLRGRS